MSKCHYESCQLPDNNKRYIMQGAYILIGIFVLLSRPENFTFFQTMLFTCPILIDIVCAGPTNRLSMIVRWIIGVADSLIIIACVLGLGGVVVQTATSYSIVESMLLFGGLAISKTAVAILLVANLIIPVVYYVWSPCKTSMKEKKELMMKREVRK